MVVMLGKYWRTGTNAKASSKAGFGECNAGQGVVEYAGALVIATFLVSTVLAIFPYPFGEVFYGILTDTISYFATYLPS